MAEMLHYTSTQAVKNFAEVRRKAQRAAVGITNHGKVTEVLISKADHDDYLRLKAREPQALWAWELSPDLVRAVGEARMDKRHEVLDALMED